MKPAADRSLRIDGAPATTVEFRFDGRPVSGRAGESVATALLAAGVRTLGESPVRHAPRGMLCAIGVCQECVVVVAGRRQPACATPVAAGLDVTSIPCAADVAAP
jgi:predicted molibdopterin-dependent oxidoreductase YjgC